MGSCHHPAQEAGVAPHLRTGIVVKTRRSTEEAPPVQTWVGWTTGSGRQWQSWISIDDEVGAIVHLLSTSTEGVRLTAPNPVTNKEFTAALGKAVRSNNLQRPRLRSKAARGITPAEELLLTGQRVLPTKLQESGYEFTHQTLEEAPSSY